MIGRALHCSIGFVIALGLVCVFGCSGSSIVPVEGQVTLDGKPLAEASVVLAQKRATDPGPFVGTTDADGHFKIGTADDVGGGAAPGAYRLMITTVKSTGGSEFDPPPTQKEVVPPDYRNGSRTFSVPADGITDAIFDLKTN